MSLYDELAAYSGQAIDLVRVRCQYSAYELAWQWNRQDRSNPELFYSESDLYLYDLTEYQTRLHNAGWHEWLAHLVKTAGVKTVLDFGGGIGEASLTCWKAGAVVHYVELLNTPQRKYARHRFARHEATISISNTIPASTYDLVIAMDVLEHMRYPQVQLEQFQQISPALIANCDGLNYGVFHPMHISYPDPTPWYSKSEGNLWLRRDKSKFEIATAALLETMK
jgi:2-polyprenyl-3-methyl-5-hydroxy-6-metoxy-1,4-benzoquinol methylase